eukprot:38383-Chlamydomonas_euryale.AAC.2
MWKCEDVVVTRECEDMVVMRKCEDLVVMRKCEDVVVMQKCMVQGRRVGQAAALHEQVGAGTKEEGRGGRDGTEAAVHKQMAAAASLGAALGAVRPGPHAVLARQYNPQAEAPELMGRQRVAFIP